MQHAASSIAAVTFVFACAIAFGGGATTAHAQLKIDRYTAPVAPEDLLWTERAHPGGDTLRPFARLSLMFADDPLVARDVMTGEEWPVIDEQGGFYLSLGTAIEALQIYAQLPFFTLDPATAPAGAMAPRPEQNGFGDLTLGARYPFLRGEPLELALALDVTLPTGSESAAASSGNVSLRPRVIVSRALWGQGFVSGSIGSALSATEQVGEVDLGSELTWSLGGFVDVVGGFGPLAELSGATLYTHAFAQEYTPMEGTLGARYAGAHWSAMLGASTGFTFGVGTPDARLLASAGYRFDTDDEPPAPPPVLDRDHDGVLDRDDACPAQPEDRDGFEDTDGCPEDDNDRDTILDTVDGCPLEVEDKDGFEDQDGCPDPDNDADGVLDAADKCPLEAEDKDGFEDEDGCPDPDNDGDGILDAADKCPLEAETKNGREDDDGCPDLVRVDRQQGRILILEKIHFKSNSDAILARSFPMLEEMAATLAQHADLGKVSIEGHTDDKGGAASNLRLSQRRADSVLRFLVERGVGVERLSATGFGETKPLRDNASEEGRAENRRVEFHLTDFVAPEADFIAPPDTGE